LRTERGVGDGCEWRSVGLQVGDSTTFVVPWSVDAATLTPTGMTVGVDQQRHELS
jgi:hypothetical protein